MEIIPVIDIKEGFAVRAYKGERERYEKLCDAVDIAKEYVKNKFNKIYIADLDGIIHSKRNFDVIKSIASLNVNLMVDFGIRNIKEYNEIKEKIKEIKGKIDLIAGTETYSDKFPEDAIISLDFSNGKFRGKNFDECIEFLRKNKNEFIVIDLKHIGTENLNVELCNNVFEKIGRKFIYGGGVTTKNIYNLEKYCKGVIIGTEIYKKLNLIR